MAGSKTDGEPPVTPAETVGLREGVEAQLVQIHCRIIRTEALVATLELQHDERPLCPVIKGKLKRARTERTQLKGVEFEMERLLTHGRRGIP